MSILVTGVAGFIGYHAAEALLARGEQVIGVDNVNDYYDTGLKEARLARLAHTKLSFCAGRHRGPGSDVRFGERQHHACAASRSAGGCALLHD